MTGFLSCDADFFDDNEEEGEEGRRKFLAVARQGAAQTIDLCMQMNVSPHVLADEAVRTVRMVGRHMHAERSLVEKFVRLLRVDLRLVPEAFDLDDLPSLPEWMVEDERPKALWRHKALSELVRALNIRV